MSEKPELHVRLEEGPSTLTQDEAWKVIDSAVRMFTDPAYGEHHILHSPHSIQYQEGQREMLRHLVGGMNPCIGITETHVKSVASGMHKIHEAYSAMLSDTLLALQEAIQTIPIDQLIMKMGMHDMSAEIDNPSIKAQLDAYAGAFDTAGSQAMIAKPCEQIATLFAVAQALLGSQEEMAKAQVQIMSQIAPEHRKDLNVTLSAQVAGSLSLGISMRVMNKEFVKASVLGFGEAWNVMQRTAIMPFLPMWDDSPHNCFGKILDNSDEMLAAGLGVKLTERERTDNPEVDDFVRKAEDLNLKPKAEPLEADAPDNMKATSTLFPGTRSVN